MALTDREPAALAALDLLGGNLNVGVVRFLTAAVVSQRLTGNFTARVGVRALLPAVTAASDSAWLRHRRSGNDESMALSGLTVVMPSSTLRWRSNAQTV